MGAEMDKSPERPDDPEEDLDLKLPCTYGHGSVSFGVTDMRRNTLSRKRKTRGVVEGKMQESFSNQGKFIR